MKWLRIIGLLGLALVVAVAIGWRWLLHSKSGAHWFLSQARSATGEALQVQSLSGDLGSGLYLEEVSYMAETMAVDVAELRLLANVDLLPPRVRISNGQASSISLTQVEAEQQYVLPRADFNGALGNTLTFTALLSEVPVPYEIFEPLDLQLDADGDLEELDVRIVANNLDIRADATLRDLATALSWEAEAELSNATLQIPQQELSVDELRVDSAGSLATPIQWRLDFDGPDLAVAGNGEVVTGEDWSVDAALTLARFNPNALVDNWPAEHTVEGELSMSLNRDQLVVDKSQLRVPATATTLNIDARLDRDADIADGQLQWSNLAWPSAAGAFSEAGSVSVSGSPGDWQISGDVKLASDVIPEGQFIVEGSGDRDHLVATILESQILGGNLAGQIEVSWRENQAWSAELNMSELDLAALDPRLPSAVSGNISAQGSQAPYLREIALDNVSGELLALPISANGGLTLTSDNIVAAGLKVRHGDSRIAANGDPRSSKGIEISAALDDLGQYLQDANGAVDFDGRLSLATGQPFVRVTGTGFDIRIGELQATSIDIREGTDGDCPINTELVAPQLNIGDDALTAVTLEVCGDETSQQVSLVATYDLVDIDLTMNGSGNKFPLPDRWDGELQQLIVELEGEPRATLTEPVGMSFGPTFFDMPNACLRADNSMELCTHVTWLLADRFDVTAQMAEVPLRLISTWLPLELEFSQYISGQLRFANSQNTGLDGRADVSLTPGEITSTRNSDITIPTDPGKLFFEIIDGRALAGSADIPMPGFGHIAADLAIADVSEGLDSALDANVDIELSDMTLVAALVPMVNEAHGFFGADLKISGSLSAPLLVGEFSVADGSLMLVPLGMQFERINLESKLFDDGQMELSGTFYAGEGRAEIFTRSDYAATGAKGFELELRGKNLTLIDVPDIKALTDIDVFVNYDYDQLEVGGDILIPTARVRAARLAVSQDTESEDVVIVAGDLPDEEEETASEDEIKIAGSVGIELGDDVSMDLGLATANITGKTTFLWDNSMIPLADGRYDVTGAVQAFGQTLEITEGGLRFPKILADNPFVRIRAEREIYGNAQVKTAGVLVDGRLRQLAVEAYTRPVTTEERALTLLVTGSDFDFEQGVGAIDFGTYIAPRVYVSYGVGLFETENIIRVRYDLTRGFGVTATSGEKESGIDLSYRLER